MKKILVVDHDPDILYVVSIILGQQNLEVKCLQNPYNIHYEIGVFNPDLILIDIFHSGVDGRSVCQDIKSIKNPPKVVLFSANDALLKTYLNFGADGFIAKPFDIKEFCAEITSHLSNKKCLSIYSPGISSYGHKTSI